MALFGFTKTGEAGRDRKSKAAWCLLPILLACSLGVIASGCRTTSGTTDGTTSGSDQGDWVAKVNDDTITVGNMYDFMRHLTPQQMASAPSMPIGRFAVSQLINSSLVSQLAKKQNVPVTDQEVDQRYTDEALLESLEFTMPYDQYLTDQGQSPDSMKQFVLRNQVAQFNLMTRNVQATPAEMQAYYNSHKSMYTVHKAVEIERLVLPSKDAAQQVYDAVSKGTPMANFQSESAVPATLGPDPALIPQWIPIDPPAKALGPLVAPLAAAKSGDTFKPVQIGTAWWVVHVVEARPASVVPYDKVQNLVRQSILQTKAGPEAESGMVKDLQDFSQTAVITVNPPEYRDIVQQIKNPTPAPGLGAPAPAPGGPAPQAGSPAPAPGPAPSGPGQ